MAAYMAQDDGSQSMKEKIEAHKREAAERKAQKV
jgi:hypothetical protein